MEKTAGDGVLYGHDYGVCLGFEKVFKSVALNYGNRFFATLRMTGGGIRRGDGRGIRRGDGRTVKQAGCLFVEAALISLYCDLLH